MVENPPDNIKELTRLESEITLMRRITDLEEIASISSGKVILKGTTPTAYTLERRSQ